CKGRNFILNRKFYLKFFCLPPVRDGLWFSLISQLKPLLTSYFTAVTSIPPLRSGAKIRKFYNTKQVFRKNKNEIHHNLLCNWNFIFTKLFESV
ncbi:hypothetical protein, partial [Sphingobacterium sp. SGL-16]|uniref:hypothetical protein n=1 Tax=Sphingobacterium sp. SGL-16 TaxID=2710883 RepID=UPI0019D2C924